ncbi:MAG TPA: DUF2383 domain-containing protein [Myxococcota bacterium]
MYADDVIEELNSFLRGEISAVETYAIALEKISAPHIHAELVRCQNSHRERVNRLTQKVVALGGDAATQSGVWGAFAKLTEGGARLFGMRAALAALEQGEDHGRDDYRRGLHKLVGSNVRPFVEELLTRQLDTHGIVSGLLHDQDTAHRTV